MARVKSEYNIERIYISDAPAVQVYFRREYYDLVDRIRKIADQKATSFSEVTRDFLCAELGVTEEHLWGEIKKRTRRASRRKSISRLIRNALINQLNGG